MADNPEILPCKNKKKQTNVLMSIWLCHKRESTEQITEQRKENKKCNKHKNDSLNLKNAKFNT